MPIKFRLSESVPIQTFWDFCIRGETASEAIGILVDKELARNLFK